MPKPTPEPTDAPQFAQAEPPPTHVDAVAPSAPRQQPDPTRYGDWEKNGRCVDF
ncbi:MAG: DUF1674 domain-containing protein [Xanthomonadaceae bacterium]|nr:DUF1674 domain-containing protein [Xanthomonadaceae bacterium]